MKILLFGGTGLVGSRFIELNSKDFEIVAPEATEVDLLEEDAVRRNINEVSPRQVLYAAAYTNVDQAEKDSKLCYKLNVDAVKVILIEAKNLGIPFYYLSTDYVFDGTKKDSPYTEEDRPNPLSVYARSKYEGEQATLEASNKNSVLRLIMPYSATHTLKSDLVRTILSRLKEGNKVSGIIDQKINPIFVDDLVMAINEIIKKMTSGIYHLGASTFTTPFEFANLIADKFELDNGLIAKTTFEEFSKTRVAVRPQHSWLDASKFRKEFGENILHSVQEGLELFKKKYRL